MLWWCWTIRRDLTALVDAELAPRRDAAVRAHLDRCGDCAERYRDADKGVMQQRELLPLAAGLADVPVESLLRQVTRRTVNDSERFRRQWWQPAAVAAMAAVALVVVTGFGLLDPALIAVGLQDPPEVVAEQPELFRDYALFEYLDALEHFDDIRNPPPRGMSDGQENG